MNEAQVMNVTTLMPVQVMFVNGIRDVAGAHCPMAAVAVRFMDGSVQVFGFN